MAQGTLKINTNNILPIIKKWLYSEKEIFLRELISNSCDAIGKLKILCDLQEATIQENDFRIEVRVDAKKRTIQVIDNGLGMTFEEVEKYIAELAFSGAEEFVAKYQTANERDQIIGHFGLGFYSSYMVSEKVEIETLSYKEDAKPVFWSCDGSSEYTIEEGSRKTRGTTVTLYLDKESDEFLDLATLRKNLTNYCSFLPYAIYLEEDRINPNDPLWLKNPSECNDKEYIDFFHTLYPLEPDPIFWVHLKVDYPFNLKGILYFPKLHRRFDWNQSNIKLFCNRVFVSDNCKDLIPDFLMILRGALDSPDIPLNVSRSYLQMDRTVRQLASHISKKIADKLSNLYEADRAKFLSFWPDIEMIIKLGALQDDKFYEKIKSLLLWKNVDSEWTTAEEYIEKHNPTKIFYTSDEKHSSDFLSLYKEKKIEVLIANGHLDTSLMHLIESKLKPVKFQRIDGALDESLLDKTKEKTLLDSEGKTEGTKIADYFQSTLELPDLTIEAKSLASNSLPAFIVIDEGQRRMKEFMALSDHTFSLPEKRTFVLNTNSKLVDKIYRLKEKEPELASKMARHLYEVSQLSQKELSAHALSDFIARSNTILEQLMEKL
jgi:molecular chaperone HtpG